MSCAICQLELGDDIVELEIGAIHDQCFACHTCFIPFDDDSFIVQGTRLYCQEDYCLQLSNRCKRCAHPIEGKCVSAVNGKWHTEHFICENCARPLYNLKYTTRDDDKSFCASCEKSLREQGKAFPSSMSPCIVLLTAIQVVVEESFVFYSRYP